MNLYPSLANVKRGEVTVESLHLSSKDGSGENAHDHYPRVWTRTSSGRSPARRSSLRGPFTAA